MRWLLLESDNQKRYYKPMKISNAFNAAKTKIANHKKASMITGGALALAIVAAAGAPAASVFSSTASSTTNVGTGKVLISTTASVDVKNLLPGDTVDGHQFEINNTQSTAPVEISLSGFTLGQGLPGNLDLSVFTVSLVDNQGHVLFTEPLSAFQANYNLHPGGGSGAGKFTLPADLHTQIPAGGDWVGYLKVGLDQSAGNAYQNLNFSFAESFTGTQIVQ